MTIELGLMLASMLMIGSLVQWLAWRVKLPARLFLLLAGILLGPVSGVLNPDKMLGGLLFSTVSLAVVLILFEGSLLVPPTEASAVPCGSCFAGPCPPRHITGSTAGGQCPSCGARAKARQRASARGVYAAEACLNCASSVEPVNAVVEDWPCWIACVTESK